MKKERVVFFSFVSDNYYYPCGTHLMVNSFKRFHPDIELVIFRQDVINQVMDKKQINFFNAKPTFAKLLAPYYDLVVNIDADHIILGKLDSVLATDYEVGAAWNYNDYENRTVGNVTEKQFLNAGMVASRNPKFWDIWERENANAYKYVCAENDILCLTWYNDLEVKKMKRKIFDKDIPDFYGCKSLGKEAKFKLKGNKIMCGNGQVLAYHHAKGGSVLPKLQFETLPFKKDVVNFMNAVGRFGTTQRYGKI